MSCKSKFFGPRAEKFRRAETTSVGSLGPPKKRDPRAETRGILVPRVFALMTNHEKQSSGVENLVLFAAGRKMASKNPKNSSTILIWRNDAKHTLIELLSEETVQFALENT